MLRRKTVSVRAAAVIAAALVTSSQVHATELFWNVGVTGDFTNTANYTGTPTPPTPPATYKGTSDIFDIGGGGTANYPGTVPIASVPTWDPSRLRIGHNLTNGGTGTLNMTDGAITPGGNGGTGANGTTAGIVVGLNADGILNMSGGSITSTRFVVIGSDGTSDNTGLITATGTLNLSGTGLIRSSNEHFLVGGGNAGIVNITGGTILVESPSTTNPIAAVADFRVGHTVASTYTQSGGAVRVSRSFLIDRGSTVSVSGGTIDTETKHTNTTAAPNTGHNAGNFIVGRADSANEVFNLSDTGVVNVGHRFLMGTATNSVTLISGSVNAVTNQTGGTLNVDLNMSISDTGGSSTYNFSGGTIKTGFDYDNGTTNYGNFGDVLEETNPGITRIGRRGTGVFNHTGGIANFGTGLGMGDDDGGTTGSTGTYTISAGEMHTQLLATQTGAALRIGTAGVGTFRVVGDDGVVDVNGDMLLDNTAKGLGTLAYKFEASDSLSTIDVSGTATLNSLAAVTLDDSVAAPAQTSYDLLTASKVIDNGIAFTAPAGWNYYVTSGGNGEVLRAIQGTAPTVLYWDTDAATPGSGGASPAGNWDGATTNFTTSGTGSSATTTAATTAADDVVFSAGADSTGSYTVTVSGTQAAGSVGVTRGNVTLTGGTLAVGTFFVAPGASAAVNSVASGNGSGAVTKTGAGTLTLGAANTMTSTTVSTGTLVAGHGDAFGGGSVNVANGALAQAQAGLPKAVTVTTLATNTSGKFDLTNNSMVVKGMSDTQVKAEIVKAYNAGAWNGAGGLTSSTAAAAVTGTTGIGYALNSDLGTLTSFKGVTGLTGTDVLVKYTYYGDADLDGDVDGNDVGNWAGNFTGSGGSSTKSWFQGDWDYDGDVDGNDVGLWAGNFTGSGGGMLNLPNAQPGAIAALEAMGFTVVPEPASLGLLGLAGAGLLGRRRRANA